MKKIIPVLFLLVLLTLFSGCAKNNVKDTSQDNTAIPDTASAGSTVPVSAPELNIADYFPMSINTKYVYEGKGNEYASFSVYNDYVSEGKVQQRVDNGGTAAARVIGLKDGSLTRILYREEAYYRENLLDVAGSDEEILLMEPIKKGTQWKVKDSIRIITDTEADITTPSGKYKAIEVTTEGKNDKVIEYYAKNVGLIKTVFTSGDLEVTSSLGKIEKDHALVQRVRFYYPGIEDGKLYFETRDVSFKTNDITKQVLEKAYKDIANAKIGNTFTTNTKINSLYLNKDGMVYLDLNNAFQNDINAGAEFEKQILQCIANTFGHYYNSDKVILTIDNKPYNSGHIAMKKGEYIKVNDDNAVEFKL